MNALNWPALVAETLRRRKAERMTQKEHAALADVSIPTIVAFDKGERTLSLNKAFDILRVVGLVEEPVPEDAQDTFVRESFGRWRTLSAELPAASPARLRHGWCRIDYALDGPLKAVRPLDFPTILREAIVPYPKWPMFGFPDRPAPGAQETDGRTECWFRPDVAYSPFFDFWRADQTGRMFLIRGYAEDAQETFSPGTIFDAVLPLWRLSEALLHASRLAALLSVDATTTIVHLRILFSGLAGRTLRTWSKPMSADFLLGSHPSRGDEALLEIAVPAADIENNLSRHVRTLAAPLFERFGVAGLSETGIDTELAYMRLGRSAP